MPIRSSPNTLLSYTKKVIDVTTIGLAAGFLQFAAYIWYAFAVVKSETNPNGMSWLMWSYGTFVFFFVEYDIGTPYSVLFLPFVCMLSSIGIALFSFTKRSYIPPERNDYFALSIDVTLLISYLSILYLIAPKADALAIGFVFLILTSLSTITTFYPILRTTYLEPSHETPIPWFIWTLAYSLLLYTVVLENLSWLYMLYPILNIFLHASIGMLGRRGSTLTQT